MSQQPIEEISPAAEQADPPEPIEIDLESLSLLLRTARAGIPKEFESAVAAILKSCDENPNIFGDVSRITRDVVDFICSEDYKLIKTAFAGNLWLNPELVNYMLSLGYWPEVTEIAKGLLPYFTAELGEYLSENRLDTLPYLEFMRNIDPDTGESIESVFEKVLRGARERAAEDAAIKEKTPAKELPEQSSLPTSEAIALLFKILAGNIGNYPLRANPNNNREEIKTFRDGNGTFKISRVNSGKNQSKIEVSISQVDKYFKGKNTAFSKTFAFTLQQMAAQSFPLEVGYSLEEMVKLGMYKSTDAARKAVRNFFDQQKQIAISGTIKKGRKTIAEQGGILFYNYSITNNYVTLSINQKFNMEFLAAYFTVFPTFAYSLNANAFNLCRYIFSLARQHGKDLSEKGYFNISLDSVRDVLGLPMPEECANRKYKQYIYDPIEKAIEDIEDAARHSPIANNQQFTITPIGTDTTRPQEWLKGYLEIRMTGTLAQSAINIAAKKIGHKAAVQKEMVKLEAKKQLEKKKEVTPAQ